MRWAGGRSAAPLPRRTGRHPGVRSPRCGEDDGAASSAQDDARALPPGPCSRRSQTPAREGAALRAAFEAFVDAMDRFGRTGSRRTARAMHTSALRSGRAPGTDVLWSVFCLEGALRRSARAGGRSRGASEGGEGGDREADGGPVEHELRQGRAASATRRSWRRVSANDPPSALPSGAPSRSMASTEPRSPRSSVSMTVNRAQRPLFRDSARLDGPRARGVPRRCAATRWPCWTGRRMTLAASKASHTRSIPPAARLPRATPAPTCRGRFRVHDVTPSSHAPMTRGTPASPGRIPGPSTDPCACNDPRSHS